jgi:hypothetical protein
MDYLLKIVIIYGPTVIHYSLKISITCIYVPN